MKSNINFACQIFVLSLMLVSCNQENMPLKPNIVLIMCDQYRYDRLGVMGDSILETPNLDALSMDGIVFQNAYCPSPVCAPSRASVKTGLYPPGNGVVTNWVPFRNKVAGIEDISHYLLPVRLKAMGYQTGMVGKLHFVPAEKDYGFDFKMLHDAPYSVYANDDMHSEYIKWLKETRYKDDTTDVVALFDKDELYYPDNIYKFIMGSGWRTENQHDIPWTIEESISFLRNRRPETPFFLFTSIFGPHQPYLAPSPWDSMYQAGQIKLEKRFFADMSGSPIFQMNQAELAGRLHKQWENHKYQEVIAAYYGQISMIDHYIGKLFRTLKEEGMWDNTWIIFMADHGDFNGAYGTFFKGEMYDVSAKIPLIVKPAYPYDGKGSMMEILVNSLDIYGTILDIAGDRDWRDLPLMESKSLMPVIMRKDGSWENKVYSIIGSQPDDNLCMLRWDDVKIIRKSMKHQDTVYELYDLSVDSLETRNVYEDPAYKDQAEKLQADLEIWWQRQAKRYPEELDHSFKK